MDPGEDNLAVSHGGFLSHEGRLWAFMGAFDDPFQRTHTRAYLRDEESGEWQGQRSELVFRSCQLLFDGFDDFVHTAPTSGFRERSLGATQLRIVAIVEEFLPRLAPRHHGVDRARKLDSQRSDPTWWPKQRSVVQPDTGVA